MSEIKNGKLDLDCIEYFSDTAALQKVKLLWSFCDLEPFTIVLDYLTNTNRSKLCQCALRIPTTPCFELSLRTVHLFVECYSM